MNKLKLLAASLGLTLSYPFISCKPQMSLKTTVLWVNKKRNCQPSPLKVFLSLHLLITWM